MSKTLYAKYAHLEPLTLDDIRLDDVDTIIVRTLMPNARVATIAKVTDQAMMVAPGHGYLAAREMFLDLIRELTTRPDAFNEVMRVEIVKWRDTDHTWHIHSGPIERHVRIGDRVHLKTQPTDAGHVVRIIPIDDVPLVEIALPDRNIVCRPDLLMYDDAPGIPVII